MNQRTSKTWTAHLGDLAFTMDAPTGWAEAQQRYLGEYLPGRLGDHDLGTFHLEVHLDDAARQQVAWQAMRPPIAKRI